METGKQELWTAVFRREQLLELLEGRGPRPKKDNRLVAARGSSHDGLVGIWVPDVSRALSPLPQVIVGTEETLGELYAWSGAYLREFSPISGFVRTLSFNQLDCALTREPPKEVWEVASAAVGIVIAEVWCRSSSRIELAAAASATPSSTLAYAMMRSWALGFREEITNDVVNRYIRLSQVMGRPLESDIGRSVAHVAGTIAGVSADRSSMRGDTSDAASWWHLLRGGVNPYDLLPKVLPGPKDLFGVEDVHRFQNMTAEERVQYFDVLAPTLMERNSRDEQSVAAFALALSAFLCRPGFIQQGALLRNYAEKVPEAMLWLGALQILSPLADTLMLQSGAGWRISRELFGRADVFAMPNVEAVGEEVEKLSRAKSKGYRKLAEKSRVDIEVYPMIVGTFKGAKESATRSGMENSEYLESVLMENRMFSEKLSVLEIQLQEALHTVRNLVHSRVRGEERRGRGRKR